MFFKNKTVTLLFIILSLMAISQIMSCISTSGGIPQDKRFQTKAKQAYDNGNYNRALEQISQAIALDPEYPPYYLDRSKIYRRLGLNEKADRDYHQGRKLEEQIKEKYRQESLMTLASTENPKTAASPTETNERTQDRAQQTRWKEWQNEMDNTFSGLLEKDQQPDPSSKERISDWDNFLKKYNTDNPYSNSDNVKRREAIEKISYWQQQEELELKAQQPMHQSTSSTINTMEQTSNDRTRIALVIGNSNYQYISALKNPVNDANAVAHALHLCEFDVDLVLDASRRNMASAIHRFYENMAKHPGSTGLFFYAGHGLQLNGFNYLVPVNAQIRKKFDVDIECYKMNAVLSAMEDSGSDLNLVFLDACRNNPFRGFRSAARGLAIMDAPVGSILVYSTAPGKVAEDGEGDNSIFTSMLIKHMMTPGLTLEQVLKQVRYEVLKATGGNQVPWESSSLIGNFYFTRSAKPVPAATDLHEFTPVQTVTTP